MDPVLTQAVTAGGRSPLDIAHEFDAVCRTVAARKARVIGPDAAAYCERMDTLLLAAAQACVKSDDPTLLVTGAEALNAAEAALDAARQELTATVGEFLAMDVRSQEAGSSVPLHQISDVGAAIRFAIAQPPL